MNMNIVSLFWDSSMDVNRHADTRPAWRSALRMRLISGWRRPTCKQISETFLPKYRALRRLLTWILRASSGTWSDVTRGFVRAVEPC